MAAKAPSLRKVTFTLLAGTPMPSTLTSFQVPSSDEFLTADGWLYCPADCTTGSQADTRSITTQNLNLEATPVFIVSPR
jgi:hypothetical protein